MKKIALIILGLVIAFSLGFYIKTLLSNQNNIVTNQPNKNSQPKKGETMKLGAFSVSLNVKNLSVSKEFYENLGFKVFAGGMEQNYLIMKNENALIGLFQGMFEGNILTFNPGWDENAQNIDNFEDVRAIQKHLKSKNIQLTAEADETIKGPANIMLTDPDRNVIYIDQHR